MNVCTTQVAAGQVGDTSSSSWTIIIIYGLSLHCTNGDTKGSSDLPQTPTHSQVPTNQQPTTPKRED